MEQIKEQLIFLFDEMLDKVEKFNKGSYNNLFLTAFRKYERLVENISDILEDASKEERKAIIDQIASVLPEHAAQRLSHFIEKERKVIDMNFNMNMVIYVIPILTYSHDNYCEKVAKRTVEIWNEKKVTSLNLGYSTYESIAGGFKKKLCYITTAVCDSLNKPDDCYELETLRDYRDHYLMQCESGKKIVEEYYDIAPLLVMMISMQKNANDIYHDIYNNYLLPCIHCIEKGRNEECREIYMLMVRNLQKQYLYS